MRNKNTNYIMTASIQRFTTFFTCSAILFIILGSKTEVDSSDIKSLDITDLLVLFVVLDVDVVVISLGHGLTNQCKYRHSQYQDHKQILKNFD